MPNLITINSSNNKSQFTGKLVLTEYALKRVAEHIAKETPINLKTILLGDKFRATYDSSVSEMGNVTQVTEIPDGGFSIVDNELTIKCTLDIVGGFTLQEIGICEVTDEGEFLFAYASGFSMTKEETVIYDLVINLSLSLLFKNEHYSKYNVILQIPEYVNKKEYLTMQQALTHFQLDFERCIERNARHLGYFRPQLFSEKQAHLVSSVKNFLTFSRYNRIINQIGGKDELTDCYLYTSGAETAYTLRNLADETCYMKVDGKLQISNKDNIDLTKPMSLVFIGELEGLENGFILGKINPNFDEYYFDIRIVDEAIQFTIYSYDPERVADASAGLYDERKLVGHYRVKYFPTSEELTEIVNKEVMYSFVYNGDIENPKLRLYIGTTDVTGKEGYVVDNFNYFGPCPLFKESCTLRNYTQTSELALNEGPMYYPSKMNMSSIFSFNKELTLTDINYMALIYQS